MSETEQRYPHGVTVEDFLEKAAAAVPVPGGGGIAAMAGALGCSMLEMALNFTAGKKKYAAVDARARELLAEIEGARKRLLELVAADGEGYGEVSRAMKMPRETEEEKTARRLAMNAAMRKALQPPLEMVRLLAKVAALAPETAAICNPNLIGDAGVAAALLPGALKAAALNVWANVSALDDEDARAVVVEVNAAAAAADKTCTGVHSEVDGRLCPKKAKDPT